MKLAEAFVLLILFVDASLVPHFQNTVHRHSKISELRHSVSKLHEGVRNLSALLLGKQQDLVGSLDELLAFGPRIGNRFNFVKDLLVLESEHDHLMLQDSELENAVQPRANQPGSVAQLLSESRRDEVVHQVGLDDFHLGKRHLWYTVHQTYLVKFGFENV